MDISLGIDIGATKIAMGFINDKGVILNKMVFETSHEGPEFNVNLIKEAYHDLKKELKDYAPHSIGVGIAGQIEKNTGVVLMAPNLHWKNFPLKEKLENIFQLPTLVINDVRAAGWGEWKHGAGRGFDDVLCVFVGTGVGGAIISGGKMMHGATNSAGEVGHMVIESNGRKCGCGSCGCLESIAGGWAIAKRGQELLHSELITAKDVYKELKKGNPVAKVIFDEVVEALVVGIANLVNIVNPACIVLGGGVVHGFPELLVLLNKKVPHRVLGAAAESLKIVEAQLGDMSGVIGAATYSIENKP